MTAVAREAGVSVSTVSHVINGTRPVAPRTRELVLETMERLGFTHRPVARSLAAGANPTVGIALPMSSNPFLGELVAGIDGEAMRQGLSVVVSDTGEDAQREERAVANLIAHHISGLVIAPTVGWEDRALRVLREHPVPFVVVDRIQEMRIDQVGVENEHCTASLVEHLLARGYRRIACIGGLSGLPTTVERVEGFCVAHQRRGVPVDRDLIVDGRSSESGGRRAMLRLLTLPQRPRAVFVANDSMTLGVLRALRESGLRVPDDVAVVSFDDLPWADVYEPQVTAVAQPSFAIGARAVQMLVRRMKDRQAPHQTMRLKGDITHRTSCGCDPQD